MVREIKEAFNASAWTGGLTCVWCRECKAHTDIVHCHLLFHLCILDACRIVSRRPTSVIGGVKRTWCGLVSVTRERGSQT
jgi:hypothetical protein